MKHDCIVALSGGVESTALLHYLIQKGRKPFCFHYEAAGCNQSAAEFIRELKQHYDVPVVTCEFGYVTPDQNVPVLDWDDTELTWAESTDIRWAPPDLWLWCMIAHNIQSFNPSIHDIYYGASYGGLLKRGDDEGDHHHPYLENCINGIELMSASLGLEVKFSAPLGEYTKYEQFSWIPEIFHDKIWSCVGDTNSEKQCGQCSKCNDLEMVKNKYKSVTSNIT